MVVTGTNPIYVTRVVSTWCAGDHGGTGAYLGPDQCRADRRNGGRCSGSDGTANHSADNHRVSIAGPVSCRSDRVRGGTTAEVSGGSGCAFESQPVKSCRHSTVSSGAGTHMEGYGACLGGFSRATFARASRGRRYCGSLGGFARPLRSRIPIRALPKSFVFQGRQISSMVHAGPAEFHKIRRRIRPRAPRSGRYSKALCQHTREVPALRYHVRAVHPQARNVDAHCPQSLISIVACKAFGKMVAVTVSKTFDLPANAIGLTIQHDVVIAGSDSRPHRLPFGSYVERGDSL